ncbi:MAG: hypothetical protein VB132_00815 [Solidesulfovibrio sp.]|nr:hypothetical protein [Solidesulfovibrio sp.]MEA4854935.1 hypothetical protein [Solidesulfovibrio sp.]
MTVGLPASQAKRRGPKSRAGLKPAWVMGAMTEIKMVMVRPMNRAKRLPLGRLALCMSVKAKMKKTRMAVPIASVAMAWIWLTVA